MCADLGGKKVKTLSWFIGVTVSLLVRGAVSDELVDRLKSITGKIGRAE